MASRFSSMVVTASDAGGSATFLNCTIPMISSSGLSVPAPAFRIHSINLSTQVIPATATIARYVIRYLDRANNLTTEQYFPVNAGAPWTAQLVFPDGLLVFGTGGGSPAPPTHALTFKATSGGAALTLSSLTSITITYTPESP